MSDELACSDGAKMLIERMKSNPEEFRNSSGRWAQVVNQMLAVRRGGFDSSHMMSTRDMNALFNAYQEYVMETALAEYVMTELMDPETKRKQVTVTPRSPGKPVYYPTMRDEERARIELEMARLEHDYKRRLAEAQYSTTKTWKDFI